MKKITLLLLIFITSNIVNAQDKDKNKPTSERNNKWILEASIGNIKGVKPYSPGYFSNKSNSYFGSIKPNSFSLGGRYIVGEIFSVKGSLGYDIISNTNNRSLQNNLPSLPFKMIQYNLQVQGYANGAKLFGITEQLKRWGFLFHGGIQVVDMISKTKNIVENDHNYNESEFNGGLIFGVTPQYRISKRTAIQLDVTTIHNYRQHFNWDGAYSDNSENLSGSTVALNLGLSFSLDKDRIHADWDSKPKQDQLEIAALEKRVGEMENLMNDTDKDGVADYLDQENNSVAGVAVDTRGKMVDGNRNGVPDELERYVNNSTKESTEKSNGDIVRRLIDEGYVCAYFDTAKSQPTNASTEGLDFIRMYLKNNPTATVDIYGNADEIGSSASNDSLSKARALAVKLILIKSGVSASRLNVTPQGEDASVNKDSEGARKLVRRVTFKIKQ